MPVFAVMSEIARPELRQAIEREYPHHHYHWSETVSFINTTGTTKQNAIRLGIKNRSDEGDVSGTIDRAFVIMVSSNYFGWSKTSLWEWLKPAFEASNQ